MSNHSHLAASIQVVVFPLRQPAFSRPAHDPDKGKHYPVGRVVSLAEALEAHWPFEAVYQPSVHWGTPDEDAEPAPLALRLNRSKSIEALNDSDLERLPVQVAVIESDNPDHAPHEDLEQAHQVLRSDLEALNAAGLPYGGHITPAGFRYFLLLDEPFDLVEESARDTWDAFLLALATRAREVLGTPFDLSTTFWDRVWRPPNCVVKGQRRRAEVVYPTAPLNLDQVREIAASAPARTSVSMSSTRPAKAATAGHAHPTGRPTLLTTHPVGPVPADITGPLQILAERASRTKLPDRPYRLLRRLRLANVIFGTFSRRNLDWRWLFERGPYPHQPGTRRNNLVRIIGTVLNQFPFIPLVELLYLLRGPCQEIDPNDI